LTEKYDLDSLRMGNKIKFANHHDSGNCEAKIKKVKGEWRIGIYAKQDIKVGEELLFSYGYHDEFREFIRLPHPAFETKRKGTEKN